MAINLDELLSVYKSNKHKFEVMRQNVISALLNEPSLNDRNFPVIHSIKSRMKDDDHLREKLKRKEADGVDISPENLFTAVTDFAGVRVLHLQQIQFPEIHSAIMGKVDDGD